MAKKLINKVKVSPLLLTKYSMSEMSKTVLWDTGYGAQITILKV